MNRSGGDDPLETLVLLARAAHEADEDWRARLASEWIPALLARAGRGRVEHSLRIWTGRSEFPPGDLAALLALVVEEALAEQGFA